MQTDAISESAQAKRRARHGAGRFAPSAGRSIGGQVAHHSGRAAEDIVAGIYARSGRQVAHRRWRGQGGEIDLIVREADAVVFVEVKKARDFAGAARAFTPRQAGRVMTAAEEFVAGEPRGALTQMRFDLALVDGAGRVEIIENALAA